MNRNIGFTIHFERRGSAFDRSFSKLFEAIRRDFVYTPAGTFAASPANVTGHVRRRLMQADC